MGVILNDKEFNNLTPNDIIQYSNLLEPNYFYSKKPIELFKSPYKHGQTIILRGEKLFYAGLIDFWLSCQAWYSDGEDTFFESLVFDDITSYSGWQNNISRVGQCKSLNVDDKYKYKNLIQTKIGKIEITNCLEMNSEWNNKKVIFSSKRSYYLFYFWTGE